jgi:hypothetical protein
LVWTNDVDNDFGRFFSKDYREREACNTKPTAALFVWLAGVRVPLDLSKDGLHFGNELLAVPLARLFEVLSFMK